MAEVARESGIGAEAAEVYFMILEDLLIAVRVPAFTKSKAPRGLLQFRKDYPQGKLFLLHGGSRRWHESGVEFVPLAEALPDLSGLLV